MNTQTVYEFESFRLDPAERVLLKDGSPVGLSPKVFETLMVLVQNSGHIVDKDTLLKAVWPDTFVEENNLNQNISALRKALGEASNGQKYVETVPKRGFRFVVPVKEVVNGLELPPVPSGRPETRRAMLFVFAGAALVLAVMYLTGARSRTTSGSQPSSLPLHQQMSFVGNARFPELSADGKFIAYVIGDSVNGQSVMVQEVTGGQPIEVLRVKGARSLRWSRDGSQLMVVAPGEIVLVPRLGGSPTRLRGASHASWSPDGSQIALANFTPNRISFVEKLTGKARSIELTGSFKFITSMDWSPSGDWLLFTTEAESAKAALWMVRSTGAQQQRILEINADIWSPRWSYRGDAIYFLRAKNQTWELVKTAIQSATGDLVGAPAVVLTGLQAGPQFSVSADSKRLLYTRNLGYSNLGVTSEDPASRKWISRQLTQGTSYIHSPSLSPDGKWVAFVMGNSNSAASLYKMPVEGGTPLQLTFFDDAMIDCPVWSPDNNEIAFGSNQGGTARVWIVNASGGPARTFEKSRLGESFGLSWAPGRNILYQQSGNRNFAVLDPNTGEERSLIRDASVGWASGPRYSPDGNLVALSWNRRERGIWIVPMDGSPEFRLHAISGSDYHSVLGWSADGNSIYVARTQNARTDLVRLDRSGGKPDILKDPVFENSEYLSMAPEVRRFAFTVRENKSDVWLIENFDSETSHP